MAIKSFYGFKKNGDTYKARDDRVENPLGTSAYKNSTSVVTDSTDLVESGAVCRAIGIDFKNLFLPNPSYTSADISFVRNDDYSVTFTGKSNGTTRIPLIGTVILPAGHYIASGISGGSNNTYGLRLNSTSLNNITWYDGEQEFTLEQEETVSVIGRFSASQTTNFNVTMYPMIRLATITDDTYEPYHASVEQTLRDAEVVEGKNLLPMTLKGIQSANTVGVWSGNSYNNAGITFTINTDSNGNVVDIVGSGTASSNAELNLVPNNTFYLPKDSYILSGGVSNNGRIFYYNGTSYYNSKSEEINFDVSGNETVARYTIVVVGSTTVNNVVFKPMIRKATETDATYEPPYIPLKDVVPNKADNSVIGTVEDGTTASQAYAVGSHAIRNGKFITWKNAKAQGETINDASDYTSGDVADELETVNITNEFTFSTDCTWNTNFTGVYKSGNMIDVCLRFTTPSEVSADKAVITFPIKYANKAQKVQYPNTWGGALLKTWSGEASGILTVAIIDNEGRMVLASNRWLPSTEVGIRFSYLI